MSTPDAHAPSAPVGESVDSPVDGGEAGAWQAIGGAAAPPDAEPKMDLGGLPAKEEIDLDALPAAGALFATGGGKPKAKKTARVADAPDMNEIPNEKAWQIWRTTGSAATPVKKDAPRKSLSQATNSLRRSQRQNGKSAAPDAADATDPKEEAPVQALANGNIHVASPGSPAHAPPPAANAAAAAAAAAGAAAVTKQTSLGKLKASPSMLFALLKPEPTSPAATTAAAATQQECAAIRSRIQHGGDLQAIFKALTGSLYIGAEQLEVTGKLGEGGFADVERAVWTREGGETEEVAVKRLKPDLIGGDPSDMQEFLEEANLLRKLRHQGIVRLRGLGCSDFSSLEAMANNMFVVQELMAGGSLKDLVVEQQKALRGQLEGGKRGLAYTAENALDWCIQIADAIAYMHACRPVVVHRDIKTDNVLLTTADASTAAAKVADLGLHKRIPMRYDPNSALGGALDASYYGGNRFYDGSRHGGSRHGPIGGSRHGPGASRHGPVGAGLAPGTGEPSVSGGVRQAGPPAAALPQGKGARAMALAAQAGRE